MDRGTYLVAINLTGETTKNMPPKKAAKVIKSVTRKVIHPPYLKTNIPAGKAAAAPPLGPQLGQVFKLCTKFSDINVTVFV
jgi:hypothetical protein